MTHVHYKFSSKLNYDTVVFDRLHVTLKDLKRQIMGREKLRAGDCDLQITNAQSKEEYKNEDCSIPKGSSVIVRRIPVIGAKSSSSKTRHIERSDVQTHQAFGAYKAQMDDQSSSRALPFFSKMANLSDVAGSEEDKIKVMMNQSSYGTMNYNKTFGTVLPANYTCYRCGNTGHHIRNCPVSGDKNFQAPTRIKKSTGIPRSFMVEVDDPNTKGAMLTSSGRYAVSTIDSEAYAIGKKERPPFLPQEQSDEDDEDDPASEELLCLICHDLLSDAVVIPCCGNSYCDDCIRNALLDSEDHICPTCSQPDVSPDNLIANKFLRQAVDNFKKEQGYSKSLKKGCGAAPNPTPTPSPVPTPPPLGVQSQPWKPPQSAHSQQDPLLHCSPAAETPLVSQVCVAPPTATDPASSPATSSPSLQPEQSHLEEPDKEDEEKTSDDSAAAAAPSGPVSPEDPTEAPAQLIPLVNLTPLMEPPQTVAVNPEPPSSVPAPKPSAPSTFWENSSSSSSLCPTGGWNEPNTQQLPPSVSSYPTTPPPPLFPSPHFHTFLAAQQPLGSYPPGYPAAPPLWALPNLQGSPIPTLLPSASIPALIPSEWFQHQRKKQARSPHRGSSHRRSSSRSDSKSSKFKSSRSYSRSSSRSRSRSRSRSHGRSRPHSPYSRHGDLHSSRSSRSYSYGYKRSPTPSSSSDHRKSSHHGRHHSRKSASGSYSSRSRGEHHPREAGAPGGGFPGHLYAQHANPGGGLELDRERYLQWNRDYKEWCDKYFSSYVGHFHQLPIPLLNIPPPPQWGGRKGGGNASRAHSDYRSRLQGRRAARTEGRSPPSPSSSDSRSPPSRSSRDSRSTLSRSSSDSCSSPSRSSNESRSPPSRSSSDRRSTPSKDVAQKKSTERAERRSVALTKGGKEVELQESLEDEKRAIVRDLENLGTVKHELKKKPEEGREEESSSPDAADSTEDKRRHGTGPEAFKDGPPARDEATTSGALKAVQPLAKPDKRLDKERKSREHRNLEKEKGRRRGKHSDSRQDVGRRHKEKADKEPDMAETERRPRGSAAADSRSERNRKRKGEDVKRSSLKVENSKCLKANTVEDPKTSKRESLNPFDRKKPKTENKKERKTWPLTERDIWEGGISVKPQKKISININLDGNRKEEKTEKQPFSYLEKTKEEIAKASNGEKEKLNEEMDIVGEGKKESSGDVEIKPDEGDARQKWEKATFKDDEGEILEKKDIGEKKDDFDLWHIALREEEEKMEESEKQGDERGGMEASKGEELTDERGGQEGQAMAESTCEEKGESKEELVEGEKVRTWEEEEEEEDMVGFEAQRSHQDGPNSSVDDGSSGDRQEKKTGVKALDGHTEDEPVLTQVPRSKGGKEEERDEAQTDALASSLPPSSVSVTSEATTNRETQNEEKRERSVERERGREREKTPVLSSARQSVAPSSGKDRNDSTAYSDRDRERRRDRGREREKESRRSKEREKGRDRERERQRSSGGSTQKRNPPSSHSKSHDTERRDRRRGGDAKSSPQPGRKHSGGRRRESRTELPGENTHKSCRGGLLDSKCKDREHPHPHQTHQDPPGSSRHQHRPAGTQRSPQSGPHSRSTAPDLQNLQKEAWRPRQAKKEDNGEAASREAAAERAGGERWEDEGSDRRTKWATTTRELEEGERPSSSSSATQEEDGADGRKQEKEKRRATRELMEDEELKEHPKAPAREDEKSSGEVDDHAKIHAATSSSPT